MKVFFNTLSYLFHPLFIPLLGLFILFEIPAYTFGIVIIPEVQQFLYGLFLLLTIVAPGISILIMYWNKTISSLKMPFQKERFIPILLLILYYIILFVFLRSNFPILGQIKFLMPYIFGIILTLIFALISNFYIKISLHTLAFFGLIGSVTAYMQTQLFYNFWILFSLIVLGGIIASGRLYLKAHNLKEIIPAMVFGFGIEYICIKFDWFI